MDPHKPKLKLSDVLGALVASVASARSVADVEALRIADRYRQNELLRGLPIPRLRFSRVAITLPIVITGVIPAESAEPTAPSIVAATAARALREALDALTTKDARAAQGPFATELRALEEEEVRAAADGQERLLKAMAVDYDFSATWEADFQRELADELLDLQQQSGGVPLSDTVIREMVRETNNKLLRRLLRRTLLREQMREASPKHPFDPEAGRQRAEAALQGEPIATLLQRVSEAVERVAVTRPTEQPDLAVLVDTDAIKNLGGGPSTVTQLHLTLLEEGLEWVGEEQRDGSRSWKLTPE